MLLVLSGGPGQLGPRSSTASSTRHSRPSKGSTGSSSSISAAPSPARSTAKRCSRRWALRISTRRLRPRFARALRSSARAASSSAPTTSSPTSKRSAGRSASTSSRSTASPTARTSASVTHSPIPTTCRSSCSTRSCRMSGSPTSAWSSSGRRRAYSAASAGTACVADLAAVVSRYHDGVDLLDALTTDSIVDPTYRQLFDIPATLRAARNGGPAKLESFIAACTWAARRPRRALDQGLHASALCGDWRYPWGTSAAPLTGREAALGRAVSKLQPSELFPFDRATATGNGFIRPVPALVADAADAARPREDPRPDPARERRTTISRRRSSGRGRSSRGRRTGAWSSCRARAIRLSRARSATSRASPSRRSCLDKDG